MKIVKIIFSFLSLFLLSSCSIKQDKNSVSIDAKINEKIDAERDAATDKLHDDYLVHVPSEYTENEDSNDQAEKKNSKENNSSQGNVVNEQKVEENNTKETKPNKNNNVSTSNVDNTDSDATTENNEQPKEENQSVDTSEDDSVDTNNMDYPIHKGRIDCKNLDDCMSKSLPLQFKYKKIIAKTYYVDVIAKNDNTLGYFIQIFFLKRIF